MTFTDELLTIAEPYLEVQANTRFMQGMINGTLESKRLQYWVRVDYP